MSNFQNSKMPRVFVFLFLVFFAGVMRFYCLGEWSFGFDELFTTMEAKILLGEVSVPEEYLQNGDVKPEETQLYRLPRMIFAAYFINWLDYKLFGEDEFGSRVLMAVLGALNVGVIFLMARSLFGFVGAFILSLLILFLPEHVLQSQNNRFYIQSFFLISVVLILGGYVVVWRSVMAAFWIGFAAVLMVLTNTFGGIIWGILLGAVIVDMVCSRNTVDKNLSKNNVKIILLLSVWSILLLLIAFFHILPLALSWNQFSSWGYTPLQSAKSFINIIGWFLFLISILGGCLLLFRVNVSGNGHAEAVLNFTKLNTAAQQHEAVAQGQSLPPVSATVYWLFCFLACGFAVLILPMKVVYNPQYGILFTFPFLVMAMLFIREIYFLILRSDIPFRRIFCVCWVIVCALLNLPSLFSYYQDGGRFDNRAAFRYVSDNWRDGDRLTGFQMGSAKYYIPNRTPRFPLHYDTDRSIKELQTRIDQDKNGSGRLWIVLTSSRGGLDNKLLRWLGQNATFEQRFTKKRYDYAENNIDIYIVDRK